MVKLLHDLGLERERRERERAIGALVEGGFRLTCGGRGVHGIQVLSCHKSCRDRPTPPRSFRQ